MSSGSPTPPGTGSRTETFINNTRTRWLARILWTVGVIYGLVLYVAALQTFLNLLPAGVLGMAGEYNQATGQFVVSVNPLGTAAAGGIQRGDVLLTIDGVAVETIAAEGRATLRFLPYGQHVTYEVQTGDNPPRTVELTATNPFHALTRALVNLGMAHPAAMTVVLVVEALTVLVFWSLSLLIMWRRHDDWMAMLLSLLVFWVGVRLNTVFDTAIQYDTVLPYILISSFVSVLMLTLAIFFLLFPDGRFSHRYVPVVLAAMLLWEVVGFHLLGAPVGILSGTIQFIELAVVVLLVVERYRTRLNRVQRQQTKWFIIGLTITVVGFFSILLGWNAVSGGNALNDLPLGLFVLRRLAILTAPLTLAFAFFRYRLYEVDLVINRGMVYGTLTLTLALVFAAIVLLVQALLHSVLGSDESVPGMLVAAVVCGALFQPVRRFLQDVIDRRFFKMRRNLDEIAAHRPTDIQPAMPGERGLLTDTDFGKYRVGNLIGKGGMGEVYLANHIDTGQQVALKILPSDLALQPEFLIRFNRESATVAGLSHPSIVQVYDSGAVEGIHYIAMQYIDGIDLRSYLKQKKRLTIDETRAIMHNVADALDYAHRCGVVHRDIKPGNIMLPRQGDVSAVLMDFGIAHIEQDGTRLTQSNIMATLDYASPEQLLSVVTIDGRADVYALGVTVYQALTGEVPFKGGAGQIVFAHIQKPPPDACAIVPELAASTGKAVIKAMAKQPENRYPTAGEFIAAL